MSEISAVAKELAFEGTAGWSLERKIKCLIAERNGLRNERDALRPEIRLLQEIVADAADWAITEFPSRHGPRWLVDARKYLGTD